MIEGSLNEASTSTSVAAGPQSQTTGVRRPLESVEMTSTLQSTTSGFYVDSDPLTLQIRDQRRRGKERSPPGRTPSPDTSVMSSESDVTSSMRMELRQKRRVIEEVAVYDSSTFYENQPPKVRWSRVDGTFGFGDIILAFTLRYHRLAVAGR